MNILNLMTLGIRRDDKRMVKMKGDSGAEAGIRSVIGSTGDCNFAYKVVGDNTNHRQIIRLSIHHLSYGSVFRFSRKLESPHSKQHLSFLRKREPPATDIPLCSVFSVPCTIISLVGDNIHQRERKVEKSSRKDAERRKYHQN